ncbi:unnamed protein product, partial [Sphacelaria rigidula]
MTDVEDELWNIFSFYALHGNPLNPTSLSATDFLRLAKDCQIVGAKASSERGLGQAFVNLAFASVIQRRPSAPLDHIMERKNNAAAMPKSKLTYPEFLEALVVLGVRLYGRRDLINVATMSTTWSGVEGRQIPGGTETKAQPLLMENVLPLASRRRPASAADAMTDALVIHLLRLFGSGLREMFRWDRTLRQPL